MSQYENNVSQYENRVKEILQESDLSVISAKQIRRQIESEFKINLTDVKKSFDDMIMTLLFGGEDKHSAQKTQEPPQMICSSQPQFTIRTILKKRSGLLGIGFISKGNTFHIFLNRCQ